MDIIETIKNKYPELTKKQKKIADYMINNIDKMSFITMKELSAATSVTEVTILNACAALGFSSFKEVKYEARKYLGLREKLLLHEDGEYSVSAIPQYELNDKKELLQTIADEENVLWEGYISTLNYDELFRIAKEFVKRPQIVLCGRGVSKILAEFLAVRLAGCSIGSVVMDTELNDSIHTTLPLIQKDTLTVVISFPDYYFMTDKIAEYAQNQGSYVIALTDSKSSEIIKFSDDILTASSHTRLFLNTLSVPMAMINILTSAVDIEKNYNGEKDGPTEKFSQYFQKSTWWKK